MADIKALQGIREDRFFETWDGSVDAGLVEASEESIRRLIDELIVLGPGLSEAAARGAVEDCVNWFNDLDDEGWICTIEREDIAEQVGRVIDLCGFEYDDDWISARDW